MREREPKPITRAMQAEAEAVGKSVRLALARRECPTALLKVAHEAAAAAALNALRGAETRERTRIVRWLKEVANSYAAKFKRGTGAESLYWFDHLDAYSHAADAIEHCKHTQAH